MEISKQEEEHLVYQRIYNKKPFIYIFIPAIVGVGLLVFIALVAKISQSESGMENLALLSYLLMGLGVGASGVMLFQRMKQAEKAVKEYRDKNKLSK